MFVSGEATVEGGVYVVILERIMISLASPGIKAVIFHLAIGNGGIQTSYMVFQNVVHGGGVVVSHKDSE